MTEQEISNPERPKCSCGNVCRKAGISKIDGRILYNTYCRSCAKSRHNVKDRRNKGLKGSSCVKCGFIPEHTCQLDVDHIDGNNQNNSAENLQTLCSNCHRLKTFIMKDWEIKNRKVS